MGMSTHVIGFRPKDELFEKMEAVYNACRLAQVELPIEVEEFFNNSEPDQSGVEVNLSDDCVREFKNDHQEGLEVDIRKLPSQVNIIRFINSW